MREGDRRLCPDLPADVPGTQVSVPFRVEEIIRLFSFLPLRLCASARDAPIA
jgi:hypothetical protein